MIHLISPAKTLDFESPVDSKESTVPVFIDESPALINKLNKTSLKSLKALMGLSDNLAKLNKERYQNWKGIKELQDQGRQAIYAFKGDVYLGLDAKTLNQSELKYAQDHLRILSGLYGYLRPFDLVEPHRLEMGTSIKVGRKKNLYHYWVDKVSQQLSADLHQNEQGFLVNLASNEYFKVVDQKAIKVPIIQPEFKDEKNGNYKVLSFFAKKARGLMSRFIIKNEIENPADLLAFNEEGYAYNAKMSTEFKPVFTRDENQRG